MKTNKRPYCSNKNEYTIYFNFVPKKTYVPLKKPLSVKIEICIIKIKITGYFVIIFKKWYLLKWSTKKRLFIVNTKKLNQNQWALLVLGFGPFELVDSGEGGPKL